MALPTHLRLSRHGIYYARFLVPKRLRMAYPGLPHDWKSSLNCSNRALAATKVRQVHLAWSYVQAVLEIAVEKIRLPGFTLIERPWCREVHTTPADTPEQLAQLFDYLERTGTPAPPALLALIDKNVAPLAAVLNRPGAPATAVAPTTAIPSAPSPLSRQPPPSPSGIAATVVPPSSGPLSSGGFTAHRGKQAEWLSDVIEKWRQLNTRGRSAARGPCSGTDSHNSGHRASNRARISRCAAQSVGNGFLWNYSSSCTGGCRPAKMDWMMAGSSSVSRTSSRWATIATCSPDTAPRDITQLLELGVLKKSPGGGRSTGYGVAGE